MGRGPHNVNVQLAASQCQPASPSDRPAKRLRWRVPVRPSARHAPGEIGRRSACQQGKDQVPKGRQRTGRGVGGWVSDKKQAQEGPAHIQARLARQDTPSPWVCLQRANCRPERGPSHAHSACRELRNREARRPGWCGWWCEGRAVSTSQSQSPEPSETASLFFSSSSRRAPLRQHVPEEPAPTFMLRCLLRSRRTTFKSQ